jgi:hypothetical protein
MIGLILSEAPTQSGQVITTRRHADVAFRHAGHCGHRRAEALEPWYGWSRLGAEIVGPSCARGLDSPLTVCGPPRCPARTVCLPTDFARYTELMSTLPSTRSVRYPATTSPPTPWLKGCCMEAARWANASSARRRGGEGRLWCGRDTRCPSVTPAIMVSWHQLPPAGGVGSRPGRKHYLVICVT